LNNHILLIISAVQLLYELIYSNDLHLQMINESVTSDITFSIIFSI